MTMKTKDGSHLKLICRNYLKVALERTYKYKYGMCYSRIKIYWNVVKSLIVTVLGGFGQQDARAGCECMYVGFSKMCLKR